MPKDLENALDICLDCLRRGGSLEECLQRFPEHREELESLLQLYTQVRASWAAKPMPAEDACQRARGRFIGEVVRRREAEAALSGWQRPQRFVAGVQVSRGLATATITVLLLVSALAGGGIASANSLPGDPFYGVKRASERVALFMTVDDAQRADLQQRLAQERVQEVKEMASRGRTFDYRGVVDAVEGRVILVDGLPVDISALSQNQVPTVGSTVKVEGVPRVDGQVSPSKVEGQDGPPVLVTTSPVASPTAWSTALPTEEPTETQVPTEAPTNTRRPTRTRTVTPLPTATATATAMPTEAATATPTKTLLPTETPEPTETPIPTATYTPEAPPRPVDVRLEGAIEEISTKYWLVAGERVRIGSSTRLNQERASAQVGGWAVVQALKYPDGHLEAEEITVLRGPEPQAREFSGVIEEMEADHWIVSGQILLITNDTIIEGDGSIGATAHVKADVYPDGRLMARRITIDVPTVEFQGVVQAMNGDRWTVAGLEIFIGPETDLSGEAAVGAIVEVVAVERADGSLLARSIRVLAAPPPSATPTETAEPTPVPTDTEEPSPAPDTSASATSTPGVKGEPDDAQPVATELPSAVDPEPTSAARNDLPDSVTKDDIVADQAKPVS